MQNTNSLVDTLHDWFGIFRRGLFGNFFISARDHGLTMPQFGAMFRIYHSGACGVSDLGNVLGVTNSAASQMLERLVQLKLVTRSEDPNDRRVKQIVLTEKGNQIIQESTTAFHAWLEDLANTMTTDEQQEVNTALTLLIDRAHQIEKNHN